MSIRHEANLIFQGTKYSLSVELNDPGIADTFTIHSDDKFMNVRAQTQVWMVNEALNSTWLMDDCRKTYLKTSKERVHPVRGDQRIKQAGDLSDMIWQYVLAVKDQPVEAISHIGERETRTGFKLSLVR